MHLDFFVFANGAVASIQVLQCHKEAKIGFGSGYNIRTSVVQAIYQCPFLSYGVKVLSDFPTSNNSHYGAFS